MTNASKTCIGVAHAVLGGRLRFGHSVSNLYRAATWGLCREELS
jgi:hypothetical protein